MIPRYSAQGAMIFASNGNYVGSSEYDKLDNKLKTLLDFATSCFNRIEAGDLTAQDAASAIIVLSEIHP